MNSDHVFSLEINHENTVKQNYVATSTGNLNIVCEASGRIYAESDFARICIGCLIELDTQSLGRHTLLPVKCIELLLIEGSWTHIGSDKILTYHIVESTICVV